MKLQLTIHNFELPLQHAFTISRYTVTVQKTVVVVISDGEFKGYGEATVNPYYNSSVESLKAALERVRSIVENLSENIHPTQFWKLLEPRLQENYFALCALDCAYWDLYAKQQQKPLRRFWSEHDTHLPKTNFTIGIDAISVMQSKIKQKPWAIYKVKLGTKNDVEIIEKLREVTDAVFRVDANCAWTVEETLKNAEILKKLGVEFIEQPLKADHWSGMKILKKESVLPIIADESCQKLADVSTCAEVFHGINIKLMKCGGITPALQMIQLAKANNLQLMAGCMTESSIGISNLTQLAPLLDYIDADGALLLQKDIAKGVTFNNGEILYSNQNGSGAVLL
ncbi:L-alanine-DL-glutamate epimerase-like enolase superfamily enzyme [Kordia periserrulae]|uniref:Dipeptide epimerase n=1 Tax=Kordia periserrulae TaxID=701523 RepID=A0A2T6BYL1_9FLAO|nr:dipeptide epimerase [Kordia periserrulae]PTX61171.1 L-alanine-DL-glutamate epimerase-like enolase superfamily enzyme [Kordia periserrulae]